MKKRVLAVVLGLSLCMTLAAQAGAADMQAAAFSDEFGDGDAAVLPSEDAFSEFPSEDVLGEESQIQDDTEEPQTEDGAELESAGEEAAAVPEEGLPEEETAVPDVELTETEEQAPEEPAVLPEDEFVVAEEAPAAEEPSVEEAPAEDLFTSGEETSSEFQAADVEDTVPTFDASGSTVKMSSWEKIEREYSEGVVTAVWKLLKSDQSGYYTSADGLVDIVTVNDADGAVLHSGRYLFDENGDMVTGRTTVTVGTPGYTYVADNDLFFADNENAVFKAGFEGESIFTPWNSDLGQMKKKYWRWTGSAFEYYDANGKFSSVDKLTKNQKTAGTYTGYFKIGKDYYCLKADGTPYVGYKTLTGKKAGAYYFQSQSEVGAGEIPGKMFHGGWRKEAGPTGAARYRFYSRSGAKIGARKYAYVRGVKGSDLPGMENDKETYILNASGYILKNQVATLQNKKVYSLDAAGHIRRNALIKYGNFRYYFGSNGVLVNWKNQWHRCPGADNRYYYFGSTAGRVQEKTLWQKIGNDWYFFNAKTGNHYTNRFLGNLYFRPDGRLGSGFVSVNGKWYYFEPSTAKEPKGEMYKKGWLHINNKYWCYLQSNGVAYCNEWAKIGDYWYYFLSNCAIQTNSFRKKDGVNGFLDSEGHYTTGWIVIDDEKRLVRYVDPDGNGVVMNRSMVIDGLTYFFDEYGFRKNDVSSIVGGPYYVEVNRKTGVLTVFNAARTIPVKAIRVSVGLSGATPYGKYTLDAFSSTWVPLMGPSWGQYGTHVEGAGSGGIFIHSVASSYRNPHNVPVAEYNKLGYPASHGCIRTCVRDAKWVYEHCDGASIWIRDDNFDYDVSYDYETLRGPLGRPVLVPISGRTDPTDPLTNPY